MTDDTRERLIRLESEVEAFVKSAEPRFAKLDEMHALLLQARGAKWAIVALASFGGFVAGKISTFVPWLSSLPR